MKLVDSHDEQESLEDTLEQSKPPLPDGAARRGREVQGSAIDLHLEERVSRHD